MDESVEITVEVRRLGNAQLGKSAPVTLEVVHPIGYVMQTWSWDTSGDGSIGSDKSVGVDARRGPLHPEHLHQRTPRRSHPSCFCGLSAGRPQRKRRQGASRPCRDSVRFDGRHRGETPLASSQAAIRSTVEVRWEQAVGPPQAPMKTTATWAASTGGIRTRVELSVQRLRPARPAVSSRPRGLWTERCARR
ncbi:MAG: hypothetical protein CM15mP79_1630 [Methanobacteriota archaeon]|nr:MAG: hypothetical protein CM15mP79_1630 [Euryarchaeota archaeon]